MFQNRWNHSADFELAPNGDISETENNA